MRYALLVVCLFSFSPCLRGQAAPTNLPPNQDGVVPRVIRFAGSLRDSIGRPIVGNTSVTFTLYAGQDDESGVWQETQMIDVDAGGNYHVLLGSKTETGLPLEIFSSGEARWLGVSVEGQPEQARVLLLSVAYALKAADADRLGGRPVSDFVLAENLGPTTSQVFNGGNAGSNLATNAQIDAAGATVSSILSPASSCTSVTSNGTATANQLSKFATACSIESSAVYEANGKVGIGNKAPAGTLDVSGTTLVRGSLSAFGGAIMPPTGAATATHPFLSNPLDFQTSVYNTALNRPADYVFRWQAEPTGNDSTNTGATLNLLYGVAGSISETGISINKSGIMTFAPGQTFAGLAGVTSVATGTGLMGGPITKSGTLSLNLGFTDTRYLQLTGGSLTGILKGTSAGFAGSVTSAGAIMNSQGLATAVSGYNSGPLDFISSAYDSATKTALRPLFRWQSEPTGNNSATPGSSLHLLFAANDSAPVETGFSIASDGRISFAPGQVFPAAADPSGLGYFATGGNLTGASVTGGRDLTTLWGFLLPYDLQTSLVTFDVVSVDASANTYDLGIFDNSGNLVLNIGPTTAKTFAPKAAYNSLPWLQGSKHLAAGRYYIGFTAHCAAFTNCALIGAAANFVSFAVEVSGPATAGGALPQSLTVPADVWGTGIEPMLILH